MWKLVGATVLSYSGYMSINFRLPFGIKQLDYEVLLHKKRTMFMVWQRWEWWKGIGGGCMVSVGL